MPRGQALYSTINNSEALWTCNSSEAINQNEVLWIRVVKYSERVQQIATAKSYLIVSVAARYNSPWLTVAHCGSTYPHVYEGQPPSTGAQCQNIEF